MSTKRTRPLRAISDIRIAMGLLTRIPVGNSALPDGDAARSVWAFPLVGALLGLLSSGVAMLALTTGIGSDIAAALTLGFLVVVTGAMHEDGLADTADGLWGGWTRERRLEIMKDSAIGAYGVIAIVLSLIVRWKAISVLIAAGVILPALILTAMAARAPMGVAMAYMPHARRGGLSANVGTSPRPAAWLGVAIAVVAALTFGGVFGLLAIACAAILAFVFARVAIGKIGGQTGDILGAMQQISEVTILIALSASIG